MQVGSVWGHGAYQAPDWTADWLHRELTNWLDITANQEFGKNFADLNDEQQTLLKARLTKEYRGSKVENVCCAFEHPLSGNGKNSTILHLFIR